MLSQHLQMVPDARTPHPTAPYLMLQFLLKIWRRNISNISRGPSPSAAVFLITDREGLFRAATVVCDLCIASYLRS